MLSTLINLIREKPMSMNLVTDDRIPIAELFEILEGAGLCVRVPPSGDPVLTRIDLPVESMPCRAPREHGAMPPGAGDAA